MHEDQMPEVEFAQVQTEAQRQEAASVIREYLDSLADRLARDYALPFDSDGMIRSDLTDPCKFHPPDGRFYLVTCEGRTAGVGCLKRLDTDVGELQRLYVRPPFRGRGVGRIVATRLVDEARRIGYRRLRLQSLEFLEAAHALYRSLGFREIEAYDHNGMAVYQGSPEFETYHRISRFMEMEL